MAESSGGEMLRAMLCLGLLAGCASRSEPTLVDIEPAIATTMVATPAVLVGRELAASASVDLDSDAPAVLDRRWRVEIAGTEISDVRWRDRQGLDLTLPPGLPVGRHDVTATAPTGDVLVLADALEITAEPLGLRLAIETAPGGTGQPLASASLTAGDELPAFAVVRDQDGRFVVDLAVAWELTSPVGTLRGDGTPSAIVEATAVGQGRLRASRAAASLAAESGDLSVRAGAPARVRVVAGATGDGVALGDVAGLTTDPDRGITVHAAAYDAFGNYTGDVDVAWAVDGVLAMYATTGATTTVDFTRPGEATVRAIHATLGDDASGILTVGPGRAATLAVQPATLDVDADASPVAFTATGTDLDGNATTDLGTVSWSVASGPMSALDAASGTLDPVRAGTGTIRATSTYGATGVSGLVRIRAGAPSAIAIAPTSLTTTADDAPTTFMASVTDADGNAITGAHAWSIAGAVGDLDIAGVLTPRLAGSGEVVATAGAVSARVPVTIAPGRATTLAIEPDTATLPEGGASLAFSVRGTDADGNATTDVGALTWSVVGGAIGTLSATGVLTPVSSGTGRVRVSSAYGASDETGSISIRRRATLAASLAVGGPLSVGGTRTVTLTVTNIGEAQAQGITPCTLATSAGLSVIAGPSPTTATSLSPGAPTTFTWSVQATAAGAQQLSACATAVDAPTSSGVASPPATTSVTVAPPASLAAQLAMPSVIGRGSTFDVTMQVTNTGGATATNLTASPLTASGVPVTVVSSPTSVASLAPGASVSLVWRYRADADGTLTLSGTATGTDSGGAMTVTSLPATASADVVGPRIVDSDPFGDGSPFGFVSAYRGTVVVGPNRTGATIAAYTPDGVATMVHGVTIARDTTGNSTDNKAAAYTSFGAPGCVADTATCGPDNENGRGVMTTVTLGGAEWLVMTSARDNKGFDYAYMTSDTDSTLDFRYVDVSSEASGEAFGASATFALNDVLYIGGVGKGGAGPVLLAVYATPPAPGLDPTSAQLVELKAKDIPALKTNGTDFEKVDVLGAFDARLFVANARGWVRATVPSPRSYATAASDWLAITPTAAAYTQRASRDTVALVNLTPADRAVPQVATFGGRFYVGRNTTAGPQLWSCAPARSGSATSCESGDWALVAPSSTGDTLLTRFDDPTLSSISMVVATAEFLYIGFDSASGLRVMRTSNPAAAVAADFELDYGGRGLGDPSNTRILDAKALTFGSSTSVWMTIGDGMTGFDLVVLP